MSNSKNTLLTIGQFAALHGINKKTLMWYDEVGLFKPAVIKPNGYRYYTYYQSSTLETILMLREMNVSIGEIRDFMENRSAVRLQELLEEKIQELDKNIRHLKAIRKILVNQKKDTIALLGIDLSEITVIRKEEQYLAVVDTAKEIPLEKDIEMVIAEIKRRRLQRMHGTSYGSMITAESLYRGDWDDYCALFMKVVGPMAKKGLHIQPAGMYLRAYCKGDWDKLPGRYRELMAYAGEHKLVFRGYAYEVGINETVIDSIDDYITQIEIPIEEEWETRGKKR